MANFIRYWSLWTWHKYQYFIAPDFSMLGTWKSQSSNDEGKIFCYLRLEWLTPLICTNISEQSPTFWTTQEFTHLFIFQCRPGITTCSKKWTDNTQFNNSLQFATILSSTAHKWLLRQILFADSPNVCNI